MLDTDRFTNHLHQRIGFHRTRAEELEQSMRVEMSKPIVTRDYRVMLVLSREQSKSLSTLAELEALLEWRDACSKS